MSATADEVKRGLYTIAQRNEVRSQAALAARERQPMTHTLPVRHCALQAFSSYMSKARMRSFLADLLSALVQQQPADPTTFLMRTLATVSTEQQLQAVWDQFGASDAQKQASGACETRRGAVPPAATPANRLLRLRRSY